MFCNSFRFIESCEDDAELSQAPHSSSSGIRIVHWRGVCATISAMMTSAKCVNTNPSALATYFGHICYVLRVAPILPQDPTTEPHCMLMPSPELLLPVTVPQTSLVFMTLALSRSAGDGVLRNVP